MSQLSPVPILVTDFDGTVTARDFYQLAVARLVPADMPDYWGEYLAGRLTHFEALRRIFAAIRADEAAMLATAEAMEVDPGFACAVKQLHQSGWEIAIASAGCAWYITRLLAERDVRVTVHANPGVFDPAQGLLMTLPAASPYLSASTGIDKAAVVRDAVATHACVAFAGDGRPDLPAALLVPAERRFARGWLAEYLTKEGIPFHPFACWDEIRDILLGGDSPC